MSKKLSILMLLSCTLALMLTSCALFGERYAAEEYIRIHILANSNSDADQQVKNAVRDAVVEHLTVRLAYAECRHEAERVLSAELASLTALADNVLSASGMSYASSAEMAQKEFPTRAYGSLILQKGTYAALIINLGEGGGDNWWCVAFPPLCFIPRGEDTIYRSKILEIIEKWRKQQG
jgi:stage II sporulation protein R